MTLIVILLLLSAGNAKDSVMVVSPYAEALDLLVNQKYSQAREVLTARFKEKSDDLEARYLLFAIEQTRILDYEAYLVEQKEFQAFADSLKPLFEKAVTHLKGADSTKCLFYIANVYGGLGVMQAKTGNWFDGVKNAITSVSLLRQVKSRDPQFYAADLGLGVFNYYLSTSFKWLPFVEDKEQEGLFAIEQALKADYPYNFAAKNSLCWILIERKEFKRADSIAQSVLDEYPENTIFLRIKALIAKWTGNYGDAVTLGNRLIDLSEKRTPRNWSDLIAGYTVLVESYAGLGKKQEACSAARSMLQRKIPRSHSEIPHVKKNMKMITTFAQRCKRDSP